MQAGNVAADENKVEAENAEAKPKTKKRYKFLFVMASLIVAIFFINIIWTNSGSGEWVLEKEQDGTKIYSMKVPGSYVKQYKGVMRGKFTLNQLVAGLIEAPTMDICTNYIPDCVDVKVVEPWNDNTMSDAIMWTLGLPEPLTSREVLIQSHVKQDKQTKVVTVDIIAAPNKIPRTENRIRLSYMQNRWVYRPLPNGEVEVEFIQDMDMGGLMPDLLLNLAGVDETYKFIHDQLPALLKHPSFQNVTYDFIEEL